MSDMEVYLALNLLLEDICQFLSGDAFQSFSPDDKQIASELIHRTKKQIEDLPKLIPKANENEEYVDMSKKYTKLNDATKKRNTNLENKKEKHLNQASVADKRTECPYTELSAELATQGIKFGSLWIRKRLFLKQKVFVSLKNQWLLIYSNNNSAKPFHYFDLKFCTARDVEKNSRSFILVHLNNGEKKNYIFISKTANEATEWVKRINKSYLNGKKGDIRDEEYDIIEPKPDVEENIYNEPEMICPRVNTDTSKQSECTDSKPPLPPGRDLIPPPPPWRNSRTSLVSYNEVENEEHKNDKNINGIDESIFETLSFKGSILNISNDKDVIRISRNSSNLTSFCPFSKMRTFTSEDGKVGESFEEKKSRVKNSIIKTFSQRI